MNTIKSAAALLLAVLASGCATNPATLRTPTRATCVQLPEPLTHTAKYGLLDIVQTTRLERGPYWSEKEDEKGTFFRAPPGGLSYVDANNKPRPNGIKDGGFYIPKNPVEPVSFYVYFTMTNPAAEIPAEDVNCSNVQITRNPVTSTLSYGNAALAGAVGGAAGGVIGAGLNNSNMSYGHAAGMGAAGGAIGGLIVAAMINADVGKILPGLEIKDPQFMDQLRSLIATQVPFSDEQMAALRTALQNTEVAPPPQPTPN